METGSLEGMIAVCSNIDTKECHKVYAVLKKATNQAEEAQNRRYNITASQISKASDRTSQQTRITLHFMGPENEAWAKTTENSVTTTSPPTISNPCEEGPDVQKGPAQKGPAQKGPAFEVKDTTT